MKSGPEISECEHEKRAQDKIERIVERVIERPKRKRLSDDHNSITHQFSVSGQEGIITVGLYDDGCPGELFVTMTKEGSTIGGLMDALASSVTLGLQYGIPLITFIDLFRHSRFEPSGMTRNKEVPFANSIVDYIFAWIGCEFIPGYRDANFPQNNPPKRSEISSKKKEQKEGK